MANDGYPKPGQDPKRKIIQILRVPKDKTLGHLYDGLYAVCDDGTLWWTNLGQAGSAVWTMDASPAFIDADA